MDTENITGIILAGGKPRNTKNYIEMKREIVIRTLHNLISIYCNEVVVSANNPEEFSYIDVRVIPDEIRGIGPIEGILSSLKKSRTQKNLVVACDMPMVPAGLLHMLLENKDTAELVVPAQGSDTIEPYCAIYDKSLIPTLSCMIESGDYNIQNLRFQCNTTLVQVYNGNNIFKYLKKPTNITQRR